MFYHMGERLKREALIMEFLKIDHLCKVYGKGENQVTALNDVSLTIEKGDFTAIIGSSGSGKSTLLHAIAGVDVPTSGKIYLDGQDVYAQDSEQLAIFRRRQVGLIYQFHNLIPTLNVVENITLPILMDRRKVNEERVAGREHAAEENRAADREHLADENRAADGGSLTQHTPFRAGQERLADPPCGGEEFPHHNKQQRAPGLIGICSDPGRSRSHQPGHSLNLRLYTG